MSKLISVLEKLNVLEKVETEITNNNSKNITTEKNITEEVIAINPEKYPDQKISSKEIKESNTTKENMDKNFTILDIYTMYGIYPSNNNTIFLLGKFINALPENLPHDIRKESVINITKATNLDLNELIKDGDIRLNILNEFTKKYHAAVNTNINEYKTEISKLKELISSYEKQIEAKEIMLEDQDNQIKYESQKLNNIINFFK